MTTMTCEQAMRQFFAYLDRAVSGDSLDALEAHLQSCLDCCDRLAFSRQLDAFVRESVTVTPVPADLEARIRRRLSAAASGQTDSGS
jgi:anti-sigma factor (TIGR02949 family)